jgi:HSP20 family molecular chaperone IbpA
MKEEYKFKNIKIRRHHDEKLGVWYYSIVDVLEIATNTSDARNYWKVLKNRLKKGQNELVTKCNQLKMKSSDGKMYLTDVAESSVILDILYIVSPESKDNFEDWFNFIENQKSELSTRVHENSGDIADLPVEANDDGKHIIIKTFLAGLNPSSINISLGYEEITISGERLSEKNNERSYHIEELFWGKFSRTISLPSMVDIEKVETDFTHGLLLIKLYKLDRTKIKKIRV